MNRITGRHLLLSAAMVLLVGSLTAGHSTAARTTPEFERLQGHWQGRGPGGPCTIVIDGNTLVYTQPQSDPSKAQFRYATTFTLPDTTGPKQLNATIVEHSFPTEQDIGTLVVTLYEVGDATLRLGVVGDYKVLPEEPIIGDWEWVMDLYELERVAPPGD